MSTQQVMNKLRINGTETQIDFNKVLTNQPCYLVVTEKSTFDSNTISNSPLTLQNTLPTLEQDQTISDVKFLLTVNGEECIGHFEYDSNNSAEYIFICDSDAISAIDTVSASGLYFDNSSTTFIDVSFNELGDYEVSLKLVDIQLKRLNSIMLPGDLDGVWEGNTKVSLRDAIIALGNGTYTNTSPYTDGGAGNGCS